jgi:hypothetical protein
MIAACAFELKKGKFFDQATKCISAACVVLKMATGRDHYDFALKKQSQNANRVRKANPLQSVGRKDTAISFQKVHTEVSELIRKHGSVSNLDEADLRLHVSLFLALAQCGRAGEPALMPRGIEKFPVGTETWGDVQMGGVVSFRLANTKDTKLLHANQQQREAHARPVFDLTSLITVSRTTANSMYFDCMGEYVHRVSKHRLPIQTYKLDRGTGRVETLKLPFLLRGLKAHRNITIKPQTIAASLNRYLTALNVLPTAAKAGPGLTRHMCASIASFHAKVSASETLYTEQRLRARHTLATSQKTYVLNPHPSWLQEPRLSEIIAATTLDELLWLA